MLRTARAEYPCSNKLVSKPETNGPVRPGFLLVLFPHDDVFRGLRVHQTRLQGGDASSDSYCYTS